MIGYVTLGTNDLERAASYYDALFGSIGAKRGMQGPRFISWTTGRGPAKVDAFHAKALELGGSDEGAVGERFKGFYAGYFRDLDGNKLCVFCMG